MAHRDNSADARLSSDTSERQNAKSLPGGRRAMLRRRVRRIRRSVALFAAALFSAAFLMVYVQLASGHDPALVAEARRASIPAVTVSRSDSSTQSTSASSEGAATGSSESAKAETRKSAKAGASETATAVTTSQS